MWKIIQGDSAQVLGQLEVSSAQTCVTSPPYWGLRDYGIEGQLGQEKTPEEYVENLVLIFREVRRVLKDDGTLWLNLGDCYASNSAAPRAQTGLPKNRALATRGICAGNNYRGPGIKAKDVIGIPWMVAFALRSDGWYLSQDIIWHKPNTMPESVIGNNGT